MTTSLAIYYSDPTSTPVIKQTLLEGRLRPSEILLETSMLELTHLDDKIKTWSTVTRRKFMGRGFSGVVKSTGGTDRFVPGDRICGYLRPITLDYIGSNAVVDIEKHTVIKAPAYLTDAEACTFPQAYATAWELAGRAPCMKRSDRALVIGGTPTALLLIQLLLDMYSIDNLTVVCTEAELEAVNDYGVTTVEHSERLSDGLVESVGTSKFTCIFDCVGGYEALKVWPAILKDRDQGGRYLTIKGDLAPSNTAKESAKQLPKNLARIAFGRLSGIDYQFVVPAGLDSEAVEYAHLNQLEIQAPRTFTMDELSAGYEYLQSLATGGRVAINMAQLPRDVQEYGPDCVEKRQYRRVAPLEAGRAIFRRSLVLLQSPPAIPSVAAFPAVKESINEQQEDEIVGHLELESPREPSLVAPSPEHVLEELSFPDAPAVYTPLTPPTPGSSSSKLPLSPSKLKILFAEMKLKLVKRKTEPSSAVVTPEAGDESPAAEELPKEPFGAASPAKSPIAGTLDIIAE